jgi:hypothetical protein
MIKDKLARFPIRNFEVHAVYGVHFDAPQQKGSEWIGWFSERRWDNENPPVRTSWTPIYRGHASTVTVDLPVLKGPSKLKVKHPEVFKTQRMFDNKPPLSPIQMTLSRSVSVRKDGIAALNLCLEAGKRVRSRDYEIDDVLGAMLLAPRVIQGHERDNHERDNKEDKWDWDNCLARVEKEIQVPRGDMTYVPRLS